MEIKDVIEIMGAFERSSIHELNITLGSDSISMTKNSSFPSLSTEIKTLAQTAENSSDDYIKAPVVGTFYASPSPDDEPFVSKGMEVKKGQTGCIIEAMKMMSEVPAPYDCIIEDVIAENGSFIQFDSPLFKVKKL